MAWSPISMGFTQGRDDGSGSVGGSVQLFSRASFKNKYSSFSWTEDETTAANKEVKKSDKEKLKTERNVQQYN